MSARNLGFVVARGLAIYFFATAASYAGRALFSIFWPEVNLIDWYYPAPFLIDAAVRLMVGGLLWRGASVFGGRAEGAQAAQPLTYDSTIRLIVFGIALFMVFSHMNAVVDFLVTLGEDRNITEVVPFTRAYYTFGDLATFLVAVITIPCALRNFTINRAIAYPRLEPDDEPATPPM